MELRVFVLNTIWHLPSFSCFSPSVTQTLLSVEEFEELDTRRVLFDHIRRILQNQSKHSQKKQLIHLIGSLQTREMVMVPISQAMLHTWREVDTHDKNYYIVFNDGGLRNCSLRNIETAT